MDALIKQLNEARKLAGMKPVSPETVNKLSKGGVPDNKTALVNAKGALKKTRPEDDHTKKDDEVNDGKPGPTKAARDAMDKGSIKPSKKRKVSEEINEALLAAGVTELTMEQALVFDRSDLFETNLFEAVDLSVGDTVSFSDDSVTKLKGVITHVIKKGEKAPSSKAFSAYDEIGGNLEQEQRQASADYTNCYIIDAAPTDDAKKKPIWLTQYKFKKIKKIS